MAVEYKMLKHDPLRIIFTAMQMTQSKAIHGT